MTTLRLAARSARSDWPRCPPVYQPAGSQDIILFGSTRPLADRRFGPDLLLPSAPRTGDPGRKITRKPGDRGGGRPMLHRREFIQASAGAIAAVGLPGAARAAALVTIDAQVHCYERNRPERPWAGTLVGPAEITGDQMVVAMDAVGADGAVL